MQLSAMWGGEQMMAKVREDAEAMMRKVQPAPKAEEVSLLRQLTKSALDQAQVCLR